VIIPALTDPTTINTLVLATAVYFLRDFAGTVKELKKEQESHKLEVAKFYATHVDVNDAIDRHEKSLHRELS
jgi:hypothetical protein